jgi:hypothetical protein
VSLAIGVRGSNQSSRRRQRRAGGRDPNEIIRCPSGYYSGEDAGSPVLAQLLQEVYWRDDARAWF